MGEQRNIYIVSPVILVRFKKLAVKSLNIYAMTKTRYGIEFEPPRKFTSTTQPYFSNQGIVPTPSEHDSPVFKVSEHTPPRAGSNAMARLRSPQRVSVN